MSRLGSLLCAALLLFAVSCKNDAPAALSGKALAKADFETLVAAARGQSLRWFFWSGNPTINRYVDGYLKTELKRRYEIELERVPVADVAVAVNRLLAEKQAGRLEGGRADLIWMNGENFRTAKSAGLLYGPFAGRLPNMRYLDATAPQVTHDFGVATQGYESPWNQAQFVMIHDEETLPAPPRDLAALAAFVAEHPGRFTYPAPPDFTGSAFLRHVLYEQAGGAAAFAGPIDEARWAKVAPPFFETLRRWRSGLWRRGETYPESSSRLHQLFAQGEVWLSMSYGPETASAKIRDGQFKQSTRSYLLDIGGIANTNYVAIPFNAEHKAAALVAANFLLSPEAQLEKQKPEVWGTLSVLDSRRLPAETRARFEGLELGAATLSPASLREHMLPEIHPSWGDRLEKDWLNEVARAAP